jgi:hypothetical protein
LGRLVWAAFFMTTLIAPVETLLGTMLVVMLGV